MTGENDAVDPTKNGSWRTNWVYKNTKQTTE